MKQTKENCEQNNLKSSPKLQFNPHKFSVGEIFSNSNGKTSSTKLVGFITSMVCLFIFVSLMVYFFFMPVHGALILEFIDRTVTYFTVSAGLMGIKSISSAFGKHRVEITDNSQPVKKTKTVRHYEEDDEETNYSMETREIEE